MADEDVLARVARYVVKEVFPSQFSSALRSEFSAYLREHLSVWQYTREAWPARDVFAQLPHEAAIPLREFTQSRPPRTTSAGQWASIVLQGGPAMPSLYIVAEAEVPLILAEKADALVVSAMANPTTRADFIIPLPAPAPLEASSYRGGPAADPALAVPRDPPLGADAFVSLVMFTAAAVRRSKATQKDAPKSIVVFCQSGGERAAVVAAVILMLFEGDARTRMGARAIPVTSAANILKRACVYLSVASPRLYVRGRWLPLLMYIANAVYHYSGGAAPIHVAERELPTTTTTTTSAASV